MGTNDPWARWRFSFFVDEEYELSGEELLERYCVARAGRDSQMEFNFPQVGGAGEWPMLQEVCDLLEDYCICENENLRTASRGFENDVFAVTPYDDSADEGTPNFLFKPFGFGIEWYKYAFRDAYMNMQLNENQIAHIWKLCIESVVAPLQGSDVPDYSNPDGLDAVAYLERHPAPSYEWVLGDKRDEIRKLVCNDD